MIGMYSYSGLNGELLLDCFQAGESRLPAIVRIGHAVERDDEHDVYLTMVTKVALYCESEAGVKQRLSRTLWQLQGWYCS